MRYTFICEVVTGSNNINAAIEGLQAQAQKTGRPVSDKVLTLAESLDGIVGISKEDFSGLATHCGLPEAFLQPTLRAWGVSVGQRGRKATVTREAVADALAELGVSGAEVEPEQIAALIGVKSTQAIVALLCEHYGREVGTRGRSKDAEFHVALLAEYRAQVAMMLEIGSKKPHRPALATALFNLTGDVKSLQYWESALEDSGEPLAKKLSEAELIEYVATYC